GMWSNFMGPNTFQYHVLILDASDLKSFLGTSTPKVNIKGTNVIANNYLTPSKSFKIDSSAITFGANNVLSLFSNSLPSLSSTNFPNLNYFTNLGVIDLLL